jgi:hypothetical protein
MSDYAIQIADEAFALLSTGLAASFTSFRRTPMLTAESKDLPVLGVYILREQRTALGDSNAGVPKFQHRLTLGFSGAIKVESDEENQLTDLEDVMSQIDDLLLRAPAFVNLTEGIDSMDRLSQYAKIGEVSVAEIRIEMVLTWKEEFEPIIPDDLNVVHITTQYPGDRSATEDAGVLQITTEYELNAGTGGLLAIGKSKSTGKAVGISQ